MSQYQNGFVFLTILLRFQTIITDTNVVISNAIPLNDHIRHTSSTETKVF